MENQNNGIYLVVEILAKNINEIYLVVEILANNNNGIYLVVEILASHLTVHLVLLRY